MMPDTLLPDPPPALPAAPPGEREPLTGQFVDVAGKRTHLLVKGEGVPVILLHGAGSFGEEILSAFPNVPGVRWIAPDRPGYGRSNPMPHARHDPLSQAEWLAGLLDRLGIGRAVVVAHSLAAGTAVAFTGRHKGRVEHLVLLAPFCRPTRQKPMLALRLTTTPIIGALLRRLVVERLVRRWRARLIDRIMAPNPSPWWMKSLPVTAAIRQGAIEQMARELRHFNTGMCRLPKRLRLAPPVSVVHGDADRTADPAWHLPWLRQRCPHLRTLMLAGCGHAVQHSAPDQVLTVVLSALGPRS